MSRLHPLLLTTLLLASGVASAQTRGTQVEWPRSFTGQPDFEFTKDEVMAAKIKEAAAQGQLPPKAPTLGDLLDDEVVDPLLGMQADTAQDGSATAVVKQRTKLPEVKLGSGSLPKLAGQEDVDASGFENALQYIVRRKVEDFVLENGRYSLGHLLNGLMLQAVVTSPISYAVINGNRYQVGDSFTVPVYAGPSDAELMAALASRVPAKGSLDDKVLVRYRDVYENFLKSLALARASNPHKLQKRFTVPATIVEIGHRKVVIEFNGQRYELAVRYAY